MICRRSCVQFPARVEFYHFTFGAASPLSSEKLTGFLIGEGKHPHMLKFVNRISLMLTIPYRPMGQHFIIYNTDNDSTCVRVCVSNTDNDSVC